MGDDGNGNDPHRIATLGQPFAPSLLGNGNDPHRIVTLGQPFCHRYLGTICNDPHRFATLGQSLRLAMTKYSIIVTLLVPQTELAPM